MPRSQRRSPRGTRAPGVLVLSLTLTAAALVAPGHSPVGAQPAAARGVTIGDALLPDIAMNKDGDAIAVWIRMVDDLPRVEARYRPAGGNWGELKLLAGGTPGYNAPHVAIDGAGNATAIWYHGIDGVGRIQTARRSATGTWSSTKTLSAEGQQGSDSDIVMDAAGNATAAWRVNDGTFKIQVSRRPKGGSWSASKTVAPAGGLSTPVLASSPDGVTMLAFVVSSQVMVARRPAGGEWGQAVPVSEAGSPADFADIAMDSKARATVIWRGVVDNVSSMLARRRTAKGWGSIDQLSPPGVQVSSPGNVAMSAGGATHVVWTGVDNAHNRALARSRLATGGWGPLVKLGAVGQSSDSVRVAVNARGDAVAVWNRFLENSWIEASFKRAGQDWGLAREISEPGGNVGGPVVAVGNERTAISIFSSFEINIYRLQTVIRSPGGSWSDPAFISTLQ